MVNRFEQGTRHEPLTRVDTGVAAGGGTGGGQARAQVGLPARQRRPAELSLTPRGGAKQQRRGRVAALLVLHFYLVCNRSPAQNDFASYKNLTRGLSLFSPITKIQQMSGKVLRDSEARQRFGAGQRWHGNTQDV